MKKSLKRFTAIMLLLMSNSLLLAGCKTEDTVTKNEKPPVKDKKAEPANKPEEKKSPESVGNHTIPMELVNKDSKLPVPTAANLPSKWKGFNLPNKMNVASWGNRPYEEWEVKAVAEFGFNFVRLPVDYRIWLKNGDRKNIDEDFFIKELDKILGWAMKYDIHAQIDMHVAPGHADDTDPKSQKVLWEAEENQKLFADYWAMLAKRYKGIPNQKLSFNLVNEPNGIADEAYVKVINKTIDAVRTQDKDRLMIVDGNQYTTIPQQGLIDKGVAQAIHCYEPFTVTHYNASWVSGADQWPVPQYPLLSIPQFIRGSYHKGLNNPLVLHGDFSEGEIIIRIGTVSSKADFKVKADNKEIWSKNFQCTDGEGEWKKVVYNEEWKIYQNIFDKDYIVKLPEIAKRIEFSIAEGDWLSVTNITIQAKDSSKPALTISPTDTDWNQKQVELIVGKDGSIKGKNGNLTKGKEWTKQKSLSHWLTFRDKNKVGIHVGEWGVHQFTPHDVTLKYMEDMLQLFNENNVGWTLWNLTGSFGIIDSGRSDVQYEDYNGHKLDREMLKLLQKYSK